MWGVLFSVAIYFCKSVSCIILTLKCLYETRPIFWMLMLFKRDGIHSISRRTGRLKSIWFHFHIFLSSWLKRFWWILPSLHIWQAWSEEVGSEARHLLHNPKPSGPRLSSADGRWSESELIVCSVQTQEGCFTVPVLTQIPNINRM